MSALAWHPRKDENVLGGIGEDGCIALWRNVIPHNLPQPADVEDPSPSVQVHENGDTNGTSMCALPEIFVRIFVSVNVTVPH